MTTFLNKNPEIVQVIQQGELANHSEYFPLIVESLNLQGALASIREREDMCIITPIALHRSLSFYEAVNSSVAEPTESELRVGFLSAILSAAAHYHFYVDNDNHLTTMPSYLSRWQKLEFLKTFFTDEEHTHLKKLTSLLTSVRPSENSCRKVNLGVQLRDAICMWLCSSDQKVIDFMIGEADRRTYLPEWAQEDVVADVMQQYDAYKADAMLRQPYTTTFFTTWARAKSFQKNIPGKIAAMRKRLNDKHQFDCNA